MTEILEPHTHTHGDNPFGVLTKKLGPLPGWAYVLIAVGGVVAYKWWKARNTPAAPVGDAGADVVSGDASGVGSGASDAGSLGMGGTGTVTTTPIPVATTNAQWAASVTQAMVAAGSPANDVANAISTWLSGGVLTTDQVAMLNQIIAIYGPPPEGILPFNTTPATTTTPPPDDSGDGGDDGGSTYTPPPVQTTTPPPVTTPPKTTDISGLVFYYDTANGEYYSVNPSEYAVHMDSASQVQKYLAAGATYRPVDGHPAYKGSTMSIVDGKALPASTKTTTYTVKAGDTLASIAQHFYGTTASSPILKANPGVTNPLTPGMVLVIPLT